MEFYLHLFVQGTSEMKKEEESKSEKDALAWTIHTIFNQTNQKESGACQACQPHVTDIRQWENGAHQSNRR